MVIKSDLFDENIDLFDEMLNTMLLIHIMPFGIGEDVKLGVIYEWLRGSSRDKIAAIYNISTGAVTNIVNEWRNNIGAYIAEDLRELSISFKKSKYYTYSMLYRI